MHDTVAVEVLEALKDLVDDLANTLLAQIKLKRLEVSVEVSSSHIL